MGWEEEVVVPTGWEERGMESRYWRHSLCSLSAMRELKPRIRCMCWCVPTTHEETEKKIQSHLQGKWAKWGNPAQGWRLSQQREGLVGVNTFVPHDLGISKCMSFSHRRQSKEKEARRGTLALFFNILITTSNTICIAQCAHGKRRTALGVGLILSFRLYVGPRDQSQPTACWAQAPTSTSMLSERTGHSLW